MSAPAVQVFDLRAEPHQLARDEWTPHVRREPADLRGVVLHQWAVRQVGTMGSLRARYGEPLALARRGLATPYTISCGVTALGRVPVVSIAHPLERYTYASDAGNAHCLAIGVMARFPFTEAERREGRHTVVDDALRAAVERALEIAADLLMECGCEEPELLTHRQCVNGRKDHDLCPGEAVVEMAMRSPLVVSGHYRPRPDLVLDEWYGKPWPAAWQQHLPPDVVQQPATSGGACEQDGASLG